MINTNGNVFNNLRVLGGQKSIKVVEFCSMYIHVPVKYI